MKLWGPVYREKSSPSQRTEISACACSAWCDLTRLGELTRLKLFTWEKVGYPPRVTLFRQPNDPTPEGRVPRMCGPTFLHINRARVQPRPRVIHSPRAHETDRRSLHARKAYFPRLCCLRSARALSFPALLFCLDYRKDWLRGWSCSIILLKLAHTR